MPKFSKEFPSLLGTELSPENTRKYKLYSGLFVLLKPKPSISSYAFTQLSLQALARLLSFALVAAAWLPFRMDLVTAKRYFAGIILPSHWLKPDFLWMSEVFKGHLPVGDVYGWNIPDPRIFLVIIPAILLDWMQHRHEDELVFLKWPRWVQAALLAFVTLSLLLASFADSAAPFVYQGF